MTCARVRRHGNGSARRRTRDAARFRPLDPARLAYVWSALFGEFADALPLIGAIPRMPNCYAAFGYGGNSIAFSAIAAEMIDQLLQGKGDPHAEMTAPSSIVAPEATAARDLLPEVQPIICDWQMA